MLEALIALAVAGFIYFCTRWDWKWMMFKPPPTERATPPEGADMGNYGADDGR
jgi:hypothetical protein